MYKLFIDGKLVTRNGKAQLSPILEKKGLTRAQIDELFDDGD